MSIDEVMDAAVDYSNASWLDQDKARDALIAAIVLHVAEEVARERQAIEKICEEFGAWNKTASEILDAIYDRSGKEPKP